MNDCLLPAAEIAPLLGLKGKWAAQTVSRWKREGLIPAAVDRGTLVLYSLEDVRQALSKEARQKQQMRRRATF